MSLLQYTSKEMFSSTELIRKSKNIFDKLAKDEIEKAIILRDGKPSFMLLDFQKYEDIMTEYLAMKEELENRVAVKQEVIIPLEKKEKIEVKEDLSEVCEELNINSDDIETVEEITDLDLQDALAKIEELGSDINTSTEESDEKKNQVDTSQNIKEFWD